MNLELKKDYLKRYTKEELFKEVLRLKFANNLGTIKNKCSKRNVKFDITVDDLVFHSHCPALGIPLDYFNNTTSDNSPSIDKIIPKKGYIKGNVQVISMRANRVKSNATLEDLMKISDYIRANANEEEAKQDNTIDET